MKNLQNKLTLIEETITPTTFTIAQEDVEYIGETLGLNSLTTEEELTSLRNSIVSHYQCKIQEVKNEPFYGYSMDGGMAKYLTLTTSVTHCIDLRLAELGLMY